VAAEQRTQPRKTKNLKLILSFAFFLFAVNPADRDLEAVSHEINSRELKPATPWKTQLHYNFGSIKPPQ
jgi:hypothetical protein